MIGRGWNFTYIAASAGLQQQTRPAERVVAQAANDLTVFGLSGVVSLLAAVALSGLGWPGMQYVMFGVSGAIVLVVGGAEALARRGAASSVELTPVYCRLHVGSPSRYSDGPDNLKLARASA